MNVPKLQSSTRKLQFEILIQRDPKDVIINGEGAIARFNQISVKRLSNQYGTEIETPDYEAMVSVSGLDNVPKNGDYLATDDGTKYKIISVRADWGDGCYYLDIKRKNK